MIATKKNIRVLVTGAGGFIGHHLVAFLKREGYWVRGADIKKPEYADTEADEFLLLDLTRSANALAATEGIEEVYALAADMGGMGFISVNHSRILHNNALINIHTLEAARRGGVGRLLFTSSACVYPVFKQTDTYVVPLKEEDAYPAQPEDAYGWEKLVTERLCDYYRKDYDIETRIARFHNIYGPQGTWEGGREKAPAAISRKVAYAKLAGNPEVEVWGDGHQTRSFCYIDDCVAGMHKLMRSGHPHPLNLGSDRLISINDMVDLVAGIAGCEVVKKHVQGPQGVRGRNSDNTRLRQVLDWEPQVSLEEGLEKTYSWIESQAREKLRSEGDGGEGAGPHSRSKAES